MTGESNGTSSPATGRIDCDFWPQTPTLRALAPYLDPDWRDYLRLRADGSIISPTPSQELPRSGLWRLQPETGVTDIADLVTTASELLQASGIELAVLNPGLAGAISSLASPYYAAVVSQAVNDWTVEAWLNADSRFRGSIVVSPADPALAAAEVDRLAPDDRMAHVLLAYPQRLLGHRAFEPLFAAASAGGRPITLQSGGAFAGGNRGIAAMGHPSSVFEYELEWLAGAQPHLLSMICEGVFERHPGLTLVLSGFGVGWLPSMLWGMDAEFRSGRIKPPPGVTALPSEYVREHVRFTTSFFEVPERSRDLAALLALMDGERLLMYSSGPTHGQDGAIEAGIEELPADWQQSISCGNARSVYRLSARVGTDSSR